MTANFSLQLCVSNFVIRFVLILVCPGDLLLLSVGLTDWRQMR